jgi:hypothetical protein
VRNVGTTFLTWRVLKGRLWRQEIHSRRETGESKRLEKLFLDEDAAASAGIFTCI